MKVAKSINQWGSFKKANGSVNGQSITCISTHDNFSASRPLWLPQEQCSSTVSLFCLIAFLTMPIELHNLKIKNKLITCWKQSNYVQLVLVRDQPNLCVTVDQGKFPGGKVSLTNVMSISSFSSSCGTTSSEKAGEVTLEAEIQKLGSEFKTFHSIIHFFAVYSTFRFLQCDWDTLCLQKTQFTCRCAKNQRSTYPSFLREDFRDGCNLAKLREFTSNTHFLFDHHFHNTLLATWCDYANSSSLWCKFGWSIARSLGSVVKHKIQMRYKHIVVLGFCGLCCLPDRFKTTRWNWGPCLC